MDKKKKKFDRVKMIKRMSRQENEQYGKSGVHKDSREKRKRKLRTEDYLADVEDGDDNA